MNHDRRWVDEILLTAPKRVLEKCEFLVVTPKRHILYNRRQVTLKKKTVLNGIDYIKQAILKYLIG